MALRYLLTDIVAEKLKVFSQYLAIFISLLLESSSMIAERLELFRTQNLLPLEPLGKKPQAPNDEIDPNIDTNTELGIDSIPVVDLPVMNSRAGLYIHLHSLVSIL